MAFIDTTPPTPRPVVDPPKPILLSMLVSGRRKNSGKVFKDFLVAGVKAAWEELWNPTMKRLDGTTAYTTADLLAAYDTDALDAFKEHAITVAYILQMPGGPALLESKYRSAGAAYEVQLSDDTWTTDLPAALAAGKAPTGRIRLA